MEIDRDISGAYCTIYHIKDAHGCDEFRFILVILPTQGSFRECAQPMRDDVTL